MKDGVGMSHPHRKNAQGMKTLHSSLTLISAAGAPPGLCTAGSQGTRGSQVYPTSWNREPGLAMEAVLEGKPQGDNDSIVKSVIYPLKIIIHWEPK